MDKNHILNQNIEKLIKHSDETARPSELFQSRLLSDMLNESKNVRTDDSQTVMAEESKAQKVRPFVLSSNLSEHIFSYISPRVSFIQRAALFLKNRLVVSMGISAFMVIAVVFVFLYSDAGNISHVRLSKQLARANTLYSIKEYHKDLDSLVMKEVVAEAPNIKKIINLEFALFIMENVKEVRQKEDIKFLLNSECPSPANTAGLFNFDFNFLSSLEAADAPDPVRKLISKGSYDNALKLCRENISDKNKFMYAWLLKKSGKYTESESVLKEILEKTADVNTSAGLLIQYMISEISLRRQKIDETLGKLEQLSLINNELWFHTGYIYRYIKNDYYRAGQCFMKLGSPLWKNHASKNFKEELKLALAGPKIEKIWLTKEALFNVHLGNFDDDFQGNLKDAAKNAAGSNLKEVILLHIEGRNFNVPLVLRVNDKKIDNITIDSPQKLTAFLTVQPGNQVNLYLATKTGDIKEVINLPKE